MSALQPNTLSVCEMPLRMTFRTHSAFFLLAPPPEFYLRQGLMKACSVCSSGGSVSGGVPGRDLASHREKYLSCWERFSLQRSGRPVGGRPLCLEGPGGRPGPEPHSPANTTWSRSFLQCWPGHCPETSPGPGVELVAKGHLQVETSLIFSCWCRSNGCRGQRERVRFR